LVTVHWAWKCQAIYWQAWLCQIENITFLGSVVRIQLQIGSNHFYMDTFNNPFLELPRIGDKDQVSCSREAVLVLKT